MAKLKHTKEDENPDETAENRENRLARSALLVLEHLTNSMNETQLSTLTPLLEHHIWSLPKFWKSFWKHSDIGVKAAWFRLLRSWCRKTGDSLVLKEDHSKSVFQAIVNCLEDSDLNVCSAVWDCWLLCLRNWEQKVWESVSMEKAVLPKLNAVIGKSCKGCAGVIGPCLLPVLSRLPVDDTSASSLYGKWMASLRLGFMNCGASGWDSFTTEAMGSAFDDSLRFVVTQLLAQGSHQPIKDILDNDVKPVIQSMMQRGSVAGKGASMLESLERLAGKDVDLGITHKLDEQFVKHEVSEFSMEWNPNVELSSALAAVRDLLDDAEAYGTDNSQKMDGRFVSRLLSSELSMCRASGALFFHKVWKEFLENPSVGGMGFLSPFKEKGLAVFSPQSLSGNDDDSRRRLLLALESADLSLTEALIPLILALPTPPGSTLSPLDQISAVEKIDVSFSLLTFVCCIESQTEEVKLWRGSGALESLWLKCIKAATSTASRGTHWLSTLIHCLSPQYEKPERRVLEKSLNVISEELESLGSCPDSIEPCIQILAQLAAEIFRTSEHTVSCLAGISIVKELFKVHAMMSHNFQDSTNGQLRKSWRSGVRSLQSMDGDDSLKDLLGKLAMDTQSWFLHASRSPSEIESYVEVTLELFNLFQDNLHYFTLFLDSVVPNGTDWNELENGFQNDWHALALCKKENGLLMRDFTRSDPSSGNNECRLIQFTAFALRLIGRSDSLFQEVLSSSLDSVGKVLRSSYGISGVAFLELEYTSSWPGRPGESEYLRNILEFVRTRTEQGVLRMLLDAGGSDWSELQLLGLLLILDLVSERSSSVLLCAEERKEVAGLMSRVLLPDHDGHGQDVSLLAQQLTETDLNAVEGILLEFVSRKSCFEEKLLFCCSSMDVAWADFLFNVMLVKVLCKLAPRLHAVDSKTRDFLLCSLVTWLQSCADLEIGDKREVVFICAVCGLFNNCASEIKRNEGSEEWDSIGREWNDFFLDACAAVILPLFFKAQKARKLGDGEKGALMTEMSRALSFVPDSFFKAHSLPLLLDPELDEKGYPGFLQSLVLSCAPLMEEEQRSVQVAAYTIIKRFMKDISEAELKQSSETDKDSLSSLDDFSSTPNDSERKPPGFLLGVVERCYGNISSFVASGRREVDRQILGDLLGYFLAWDLVLDLYSCVEAEKRPEYSTFLRSSLLLENLILTLFCAMPQSPNTHDFQGIMEGDRLDEALRLLCPSYDTRRPPKDQQREVFSGEPPLTFRRNRGLCTSELDRLSCRTFYRFLTVFPAAVRQWRNAQNKNLAAMVESFTMKFVSPVLLAEEFLALSKSKRKFDNMTVLGRPNAREVLASYTMEELCMELIVELPPNYPLDQPSVSVSQRVGIPEKNWRRWMLQLTVFLANQNGSVLDGLLLWKSNVDKHLEGVEDCMICMMAVHVGNYSLPKIPCKQCRKKFHASCLYKWFNSSNSTSCPLCRTSF